MTFGKMEKDALGLRPPVQELWQLQITCDGHKTKESSILEHLWPIHGTAVPYYPPVEKC